MSPFSCLILILAFGWAVPQAVQEEAARLKAVVAKFTAVRCNIDYINELKAKRDVAGLTAIAKTYEPFSECAASRAIECLPADRVVDFIQQFPVSSLAWGGALHTAAKHHPKAVTIGYIKALMTQAMPETTKEEQRKVAKVRWTCYGICASRDWDDLAEMAQADVNDTRDFYLVNTGVETVGDAAQRYLESLHRK
jgi:hypothetical protein